MRRSQTRRQEDFADSSTAQLETKRFEALIKQPRATARSSPIVKVVVVVEDQSDIGRYAKRLTSI